jgi:hypothetical protein
MAIVKHCGLEMGLVIFSLKGFRMKRMWSIVAAVVLASGVAFGQAGPAEVPAAKPAGLPAQVAAGLPADVLAVVEFGSIETLQTHVTDFVNATNALPPGVQVPPVLNLFDEPFHSTDLSQMDVTQPARFVIVKAGPRKVEAVLQCTVKDPAAYLVSLDPGLKKGEEKDGVTSYTSDQKTVAIGESGKTICVGENAAAVGQVLALVKSNALPQTAMLQCGDVVASVDVKALLNHMADEKGSVFGDLKDKLPMPPNATEQGQRVQRMLGMELDVLETLLKQVECATVSLTPDAQELKLSAKVVPVQGGMLAAYLATVPTGIPATLKYMPEDAFAVCAFKVGNLEPLAIPFIAFYTKLLSVSGMDAMQAALLSSQLAGVLKAYGDEGTLAFRSGQGMRFVGANALKDPEVLKAFLQKMPELLGALAGLYQNMGMPTQIHSEVVKYNDNEITQLKWTLPANPAAGATPEQTAMADARQKMMQAMFGSDGMVEDIAILGKDAVVTMGSDSLDTVQQIMDGKLKKLADREDFKQTLASIPAESCGFCVLHLTGLAEFGISIGRATGQLPLPDIYFPSGPGVTAVFVTAPAGNSVACDVRVPAAEIKAIAAGIQSLSVPPPAMPPVQPAPATTVSPAPATTVPPALEK